MPRNTGTGVIIAGLSVAFGFAMIWYMWWLAALSLVAILGVAIGHTFNYDRDYYIPVDEVAHEQVVGVWHIAAHAEQLHQVVELAVYVTAYCHWSVDCYDVSFFYQQLAGLVA